MTRPCASRTTRPLSTTTSMEPSLRRITYSSLRSSPSLSTRRTKVSRSLGYQYSDAGRHLIQLLGRGVAQHVHEGRIGDQNAAVARGLVHALHDAFEQAAKFRLAVAQRILGAAPLDGDAGDLRHARHEFVIARRAECPAGGDRPRRCRPPGRPRRRWARTRRPATPRVPRRLAAKFPQRIGLDVGDRDLAREINRGGARAEADADRRVVHGRHELARQTRRHAEAQRLALAIEQVDRAAALRP